jgi:hypothetical protein
LSRSRRSFFVRRSLGIALIAHQLHSAGRPYRRLNIHLDRRAPFVAPKADATDIVRRIRLSGEVEVSGN